MRVKEPKRSIVPLSIDEVARFCNLLDSIYRELGFGEYAIKLALRPEKRFGSEEMWDWAEQSLRDAVAATGRNTADWGWEELPGEGAFYAPKLEFHLTDAIGRTFTDGREPDRVVVPLPHPSGASGWLNAPANRDRLARALELVRQELALL